MIELIVEPKTPPMSWDEFIGTKPSFSIALDGYVDSPPRFFIREDGEPKGPFANYDHHAGVSRQETRATCAQVLVALRSGMLPLFIDSNGEVVMKIYVNDCDADVCVSTFLLMNHSLVTGDISPRLSQLVSMEDLLDSTAGAYKFPPHLISGGVLNWIFAPYDEFRISGGLDRKDPDEYRKVILAVHKRIKKFIDGKQESLPLDTSYRVIGKYKGWIMVEETGRNARQKIFGDGSDAFVSIRFRDDQKLSVSIGRRSLYVHKFNIPRILEALNAAECCDNDKWGGSPTIGGSPRVNGTCLSIERIAEIINRVIGVT